jgi:hypothetical protein
LRYSWYPQNGTARNLAIGGAMGSLGGDLTATYVNPAGLAFYKTGEAVISPGFLLNKNKFNFRDTRSTNTKNAFNFGPTGFILGGSADSRRTSSGALSIAITQTANFNNITHYNGLNNLSAFSETFAEEFARSGLTIDDVLNVNSKRPYGAAPALYSYLIDTATVNGQTIVKAATDNILDAGQALKQDFYKKTSGGVYEAAVGIAVNQKDRWMFGGTLGFPIVSYTSNLIVQESDTSSNANNGFKAMEYHDDFRTTGAGVNLKLGAIFRPQQYIRIGLAVHSPSFMWLKEERSTTLSTSAEGPYLIDSTVSSQSFTNGEDGRIKYIQTSPWKAILSASYVFRETADVTRQRAFLTADVEYVNHKGSRFANNNKNATEEDNAYAKDLNNVVKEIYKGAFNFRVGGELKFNTIMGRLGFAYYGNPYNDSQLKARKMLLSGGLGYRNKGFFLDLTYVYNMNKDVNFPYRLEGQANTFASVDQKLGNVMATVGWKF